MQTGLRNTSVGVPSKPVARFNLALYMDGSTSARFIGSFYIDISTISPQ